MRVQPAPLDDGYDFRGACRLQELGRKARVPLFLCFIDLQKAYDSLDRTLLWQMLARFGELPQMIEIILQFYDGVRACVRSDNGVCSKWFEVTRDVKSRFRNAARLVEYFDQ